jgi:Ca2+-transporting ATPase
VAEERAGTEVVQLIIFDSSKKCMGAVIRLLFSNYRLVVKGAVELMLAKTTYVVSQSCHEVFEKGLLLKEFKEEISATINAYAE